MRDSAARILRTYARSDITRRRAYHAESYFHEYTDRTRTRVRRGPSDVLYLRLSTPKAV